MDRKDFLAATLQEMEHQFRGIQLEVRGHIDEDAYLSAAYLEEKLDTIEGLGKRICRSAAQYEQEAHA